MRLSETRWQRERRKMKAELEGYKAVPLEYLSKIPPSIPAGKVLVHNRVKPTKRLGSRGFRAWLAEPSEDYERCDCDWAPHLEAHYRVKPSA